jgi:23S rRNA (cytidine2498-2'-O)-methyltransferase
MIASAWLAAEDFRAELEEELRRSGRRIAAWHGLLALSPDPPGQAAWALDVWTDPREIAVRSVKDASDALRAIQRNWSSYLAAHHRRAALITDRLPPVKARPLAFPEAAPASHLGAWTLLASDRLLCSPTKSSPFVNGAVAFVEDREGPPSRAYLKLWEALTRLGRHPAPGERCLDLGASPGGWTWALARLGARVAAVDKAPLDPAVAAMPGVTVRQESAFALDPAKEPPVDWLFSDVICYPARLLALVRRWIAAGTARNIVCTVKFQGATDHEVAVQFAAIEGAVLFHGAHNKHELMFARLADRPISAG